MAVHVTLGAVATADVALAAYLYARRANEPTVAGGGSARCPRWSRADTRDDRRRRCQGASGKPKRGTENTACVIPVSVSDE